jgi:hypothetical protein
VLGGFAEGPDVRGSVGRRPRPPRICPTQPSRFTPTEVSVSE